jgi:hypothetical protein
VSENLLQGVHRSIFRLSVEISVQRNMRKLKLRRESDEILQGEKYLKSSLKFSG